MNGSRPRRCRTRILAISIVVASLGGCRHPASDDALRPRGRTILFASFSAPRAAYEGEIVPAFVRDWKRKTGETIRVRQTYGASGTVSRNIVNGLDADVTALGAESDVNRLVRAHLVPGSWTAIPGNGIVSESAVVIATRPGNPKAIRDWGDLIKTGVEVLTPNPQTSGGARWNIAAAYAGTRFDGGDEAARRYLAQLYRHITVLENSARESFSMFEHGVGDAAIAYETDVLDAADDGRHFPMVMPPTALRIELPAVVVEGNAKRHGVLDLARAFIQYLSSEHAQTILARRHFRSVNQAVAARFAPRFVRPKRWVTIRDLGGWPRIDREMFGPTGYWTLVTKE